MKRIISIRDSGREVRQESVDSAIQLLDIFDEFSEPTPENMLAVIDRKYGTDTVIRFQKWCSERKAMFRFDARIFSPWVFFDFGNDQISPGCVAVIVANDAAKYTEVFGPTTQLDLIPLPHRLLPWCVVPVIDVCGNQHEVQIE